MLNETTSLSAWWGYAIVGATLLVVLSARRVAADHDAPMLRRQQITVLAALAAAVLAFDASRILYLAGLGALSLEELVDRQWGMLALGVSLAFETIVILRAKRLFGQASGILATKLVSGYFIWSYTGGGIIGFTWILIHAFVAAAAVIGLPLVEAMQSSVIRAVNEPADAEARARLKKMHEEMNLYARMAVQAVIAVGASVGVSMSILFQQGPEVYALPEFMANALRIFVAFLGLLIVFQRWFCRPYLRMFVAVRESVSAELVERDQLPLRVHPEHPPADTRPQRTERLTAGARTRLRGSILLAAVGLAVVWTTTSLGTNALDQITASRVSWANVGFLLVWVSLVGYVRYCRQTISGSRARQLGVVLYLSLAYWLYLGVQTLVRAANPADYSEPASTYGLGIAALAGMLLASFLAILRSKDVADQSLTVLSVQGIGVPLSFSLLGLDVISFSWLLIYGLVAVASVTASPLIDAVSSAVRDTWKISDQTSRRDALEDLRAETNLFTRLGLQLLLALGATVGVTMSLLFQGGDAAWSNAQFLGNAIGVATAFTLLLLGGFVWVGRSYIETFLQLRWYIDNDTINLLGRLITHELIDEPDVNRTTERAV